MAYQNNFIPYLNFKLLIIYYIMLKARIFKLLSFIITSILVSKITL